MPQEYTMTYRQAEQQACEELGLDFKALEIKRKKEMVDMLGDLGVNIVFCRRNIDDAARS